MDDGLAALRQTVTDTTIPERPRMRAAREECMGSATWTVVSGAPELDLLTRMAKLPLALSKRVLLTVEHPEDLSGVRHWQQGDADMYDLQALEQRYLNRLDKGVWKHLNLWWVTAMRKARLPVSSGMPQADYTSLYVRVCKALLEDGEEWDEAEALR